MLLISSIASENVNSISTEAEKNFEHSRSRLRRAHDFPVMHKRIKLTIPLDKKNWNIKRKKIRETGKEAKEAKDGRDVSVGWGIRRKDGEEWRAWEEGSTLSPANTRQGGGETAAGKEGNGRGVVQGVVGPCKWKCVTWQGRWKEYREEYRGGCGFVGRGNEGVWEHDGYRVANGQQKTGRKVNVGKCEEER